MLKLIIDNVDQTLNSDLTSVSMVIGLNRSNNFTLATSGQPIRLKAEAAKQIRELFINCDWPPPTVPVQLKTDYGNFDLTLLSQNVEYCTDCTANILLTDSIDEEVIFNRLNNTRVLTDELWNYFIAQKLYKKAPASADISVFTTVVIGVVNLPLSISLRWFTPRVYKDIMLGLWRTGRWYLVLRVRDIFEYFGNLLGRPFKSTILQTEPYNRMFILPAVTKRGLHITVSEVPLIPQIPDPNNPGHVTDDYLLEMTVVELLNNLGLMFNAEFRITPENIKFEKTKTLREEAIRIDNFTVLEAFCIKPINNGCAKISYEYQLDGTDLAGDSEIAQYNYTEDLNVNSKSLTELCRRIFPFGIGTNTNSRGSNMAANEHRRDPTTTGINEMKRYMPRELALSDFLSALPKLMMISPALEDTTQKHFEGFFLQDFITLSNEEVGQYFMTNHQLSFDPKILGNLYSAHHANHLLEQPCLEIDSLKVCLTQELFDTLLDIFRKGISAYVVIFDRKFFFTEAEIVFGDAQYVIFKTLQSIRE